jgi:siroheme synthase-like protein
MELKGYPIFLVGLDQKKTVVIGGTHEAEGRIAGLLEVGANITVIAPRATEQIYAWAEEGRITWLRRDYQPGDLDGADMIIAERRSPEDNAEIWEATPRSALINIMDDVPHCNFIAGSVVRQGDLTVAISTNGKAPAVAVRLRERLERELGDEYAEMLELFGRLRASMAEVYPDLKQRRLLWYQLVDSDILDLLGAGERDRAVQRIREILGDEVVQASGLEGLNV